MDDMLYKEASFDHKQTDVSTNAKSAPHLLIDRALVLFYS